MALLPVGGGAFFFLGVVSFQLSNSLIITTCPALADYQIALTLP
jgi:hypothetical protein